MFGLAIQYFRVPGGITLRRGSAGSTTLGRYTPGATSDTTGVVASVQPMKGDELDNLPEGMRSRRPVKVYTETELLTVDVGAGTPADIIVWDGETFEIQTVEKHTYGGYWKATAVRIGQ